MRRAHQYLEARQSRLLELLQQLIRIPTVNPPGSHYDDMVDLLRRRCDELGLTVEVHRVPDEVVERRLGTREFPRTNLVCRWDTGAEHVLHYNAHYDVVPAGAGWRSGGPFTPRVKGAYVYGRGAADMKGSIAAWLMAVESLRETGCRPAFDLECSFTADEETGGELGAGHLVRSGRVRADWVLVGEGAAGMHVGCGHNGVLWMRVEVQGRSAHASRPEEGVNAFEQMAELVHALRRYNRSLGAPRRQYRDPSGRPRLPTMTLGGVFGGSTGDKINTVPAFAAFSIDRRVVPHEQLGAVEDELRRAIGRAAQRLQLEAASAALLRIAPCVVDPDGALPRAFGRAVQSVRRGGTEARVTSGFTDLHYFVHGLGLSGIGYGVKGEHAHGADERVSVHDLLQTARTYAEFMLRGVQSA